MTSSTNQGKLEDLKMFGMAMGLGDEVWTIVLSWDNFSRETLGKQWIKAADSVAANISERYGRFHHKDSRKFQYVSKGMLSETGTWLLKAFNRKLITEVQFVKLHNDIELIGKMLGDYAQRIGEFKPKTRPAD